MFARLGNWRDSGCGVSHASESGKSGMPVPVMSNVERIKNLFFQARLRELAIFAAQVYGEDHPIPSRGFIFREEVGSKMQEFAPQHPLVEAQYRITR